jgi:hypothetical protein
MEIRSCYCSCKVLRHDRSFCLKRNSACTPKTRGYETRENACELDSQVPIPPNSQQINTQPLFHITLLYAFFNAPWQFTLLLHLRSHFQFNILSLAVFYYTWKLFLMGIWFLLYAQFSKNKTSAYNMDWCRLNHITLWWMVNIYHA